MTAHLKVLHVVRGLLNSSGTTHIVVPLAEEQARQGCAVSVYSVEQEGAPALPPDPALVNSRQFRQSVPGSNPGISFDLARALRTKARSFDVIHIHAVWNFATFWTMRTARATGVPYVVAPQGSFEPWALRQSALKKRVVGKLTEVPLINNAAALQAVTEAEASQFLAFGLTAPHVVIPNGVDAGLLDRRGPRLANRMRLGPGSRVLLFLSRLHPKKGVDVLLHAFADARRALPDLMLLVAGSDGGSGYGARMQALARALGLGEQCHFAGEVHGEEKLDMLSGADAFVLPSHSEGLPVAALEAMAAGLPVILTPGCNLPEAARARAGLIVEPRPEPVAGAIAALFADAKAANAMGANGRRLVRERFTWPNIAAETIRLYRSLSAHPLARTA